MATTKSLFVSNVDSDVRATVTGEKVVVESVTGESEQLVVDSLIMREPVFSDGGCVYGEPGSIDEAAAFTWQIDRDMSIADHCHMCVVHDTTRTFQIDDVYRMNRHTYETGDVVEDAWLAIVRGDGVEVLLSDRTRTPGER